MNNQGKSSKWQKKITKKEGQKQCNKQTKKKATILWSILYSKCYLLFIYIPYFPKCVCWRMPLSKGAHQNHWNKVIQSIPSYCLYPPQPPRPANPVHKNVAMYPRQLPWNLLRGALAYPIAKYHYFTCNFCPLQKHAYSNILKILPPKNESFQIKNSDIFHISAQKIDCGYSLELPQWGSSNEYPQSIFLSRNKKNNVYPCKPQFYILKNGV